ncbi:p-loop containing nucleoside triphosphate hydrolase protein [Diplodia corticola]|uniref:p-loop containing nucleoside triphosphate hydrolase protein n=1 Tax=Diplodia corticola TaxID=236234 RepID=A0A1J9R095_9PEZI|nr:p-loop containing nucleoside triphosphate hydrolase protein [Diplodia corticola]OJD33674.1 p-loop containing nucleoside triphosphate hydrolase protein [Diplodia corticola]
MSAEPSYRTEAAPMVMVVGLTGSGKSYFINRLVGREVVQEGSSMKSCTHSCQLVGAEVGRSKVLLLDTPGFDDTFRPDSEILSEIAHILAAQYEVGVQLKGVVYMQRITDMRMTGSSINTLNIFKEICGEAALKNVLLVTSMWDQVDEAVGAQRERELRDEFWAYMLGHGATISRFHGDTHSAVALASQILVQDRVVLRLQEELVDHGRPLNETAAGALVNDSLEVVKAQYEKELADLERLKRDLVESDRALKSKIQKDFVREQQRLRSAEQQQSSLRAPVGAHVQRSVQRARSGGGGGLLDWGFRLLPTVLGLLGLSSNVFERLLDIR